MAHAVCPLCLCLQLPGEAAVRVSRDQRDFPQDCGTRVQGGPVLHVMMHRALSGSSSQQPVTAASSSLARAPLDKELLPEPENVVFCAL